MAKNVARYMILTGVTGCMPNTNVAIECRTRRDLLECINEELDAMGFPRSKLKQETRGIREIWKFIALRGSSSAHFSMHHKGMAIEFVGMTDAEFEERQKEDDND